MGLPFRFDMCTRQVMKKKILDGANGNTAEGRQLANMLSLYALYQVSYI